MDSLQPAVAKVWPVSGHLPDDWFRPAGGSPRPGDGDGNEAHPSERYTDQFKPHWTGGAAGAGGAAGSPTPAEPAATRLGQRARRATVPEPEPDSGPSSIPVLTSAEMTGHSGHPGAVRRVGFPGRHPLLAAVFALAMALAVGLAAGGLIDNWVSPSPTTPVATTTASTAQASPTSADMPWSGGSTPLTVSRAGASCTAPPATDAEGNPVRYDVANVLDNQLATAWRCNGDGVGQRLTFTMAPNSVLVGVGLVNGYVKSEGTAALYDQYRRISSVRWDLPDGAYFIQNLSENNTTLQRLMIPRRTINGAVTLTILASTAPGQADQATRNAVLLSTVELLTEA